MRLAALAVAMTLAFSGLALARDHDDDHHRDKHEDRHHDRDHDRDHRWNRDGNRDGNRDWNRDWNRDRDHDRDHNGWRDRDHDRDHDRWQREHRGWWRGDGDHDRDDGYYRGGTVYNRYPRGYPSGGYGYPGSTIYGRSGGDANIAYNTGYSDGSYRAHEDIAENKPFNPNPRGSFGNRDHGYHSAYGDKNYYRSQYTDGYAAGYQSNYRGGRGRGWGF